MRKFSKKFVTIMLSLMLLFTTAVTPIAVEANVLPYISSAQTAVNTTNTILKTLGVGKMGDVGKGLTQFVDYLGKGLGFTNTILKFLGFGAKKSDTPDINQLMYKEIQEMHADLVNIGEDVRDLANTMSDYIIEDKFNKQMNAAKDANKSWYNFHQKYIQDGMENLKIQYATLINDEIKSWWKNPGDRDDNSEDLDNSKVILMYEDASGDGEYELILHQENDIYPNMRGTYIVLSSDALPQGTPKWNIDRYQEILSTYIQDQLVAWLDNGQELECRDIGKVFPSFVNWDTASAEAKESDLDQLCSDVIEELQYRFSILAVNDNSSFTSNVKYTFNNYCTNLVDVQNEGLDAILQAMMLTNNFEIEIRETYQNLCAELMVQTGEYATFALDVIGKDNSSYKSEADKAADNWLHAVDEIKSALDSLTGYDNYCYSTGTLIDIVPVAIRSHIQGIGEPADLKYLWFDSADFDYDREKLSSMKVGTETTMLMSNIFLSKDREEDTSFAKYIQNLAYEKYKINWKEWIEVKEREMDFSNSSFVTDWNNSIKEIVKGEDISMYGKWSGSGTKDDLTTNNSKIDYTNVKLRKKMVGDIYTDNNVLKRDQAIQAFVVSYKKGMNTDCWFYYGPTNAPHNLDLAKDCEFNDDVRGYYYTIVRTPIDDSGKGEGDYNPLISLKETREKTLLDDVVLVNANKYGKKSVKLTWNKVSGTTKYDVYRAKKGKKLKKVASVKGNKCVVKKLQKHKVYKFRVVARKGSRKIYSKTIYYIFGNTKGKYANAKSITVQDKSINPGVGQTIKISAKYVMPKGKKHLKYKNVKAIRYISDHSSVAKVNSSGYVTGLRMGVANIYVLDIGGKYYKVKVRVTP